MKKTFVFLGMSAIAAVALGDAPQVGNLRLISQTASGVCTFGYTLSSAPAVVTFEVATNGVAASPQADLTGTINELLEPDAAERTFTWRPIGDLSAADLAGAQFRLVAWPTNALPDYLVIDIGTKTVPNRYYPSAAHLPEGGLKNRIYATERLVMRKIPAAGVTWYMGSTSSTDPQRNTNEERHRVTFTSDYWFSIYPVTKRQFINMGADISRLNMRIKYDNEDHPATGFTQGTGSSLNNTLRGSPSDGINWPTTGTNVLATSPIGLFRTATDILFDLPTEAQWEYACRAGTGTASYDGSTTITAEVANRLATWGGNSKTEYINASGVLEGAATPVGMHEPNAWGIYDLYGMVWEGCLDWYTARLTSDATDPKGPEVASPAVGTHQRVRKGGCFSSSVADSSGVSYLRSAYRNYGGSGTDYGIRLVCPIGLK